MLRLIPQPKEVIELEGICEAPEKTVLIRTDVIEGEEAYHLNVEKHSVTLKANNEKGFYYAKTTLALLRILYDDKIPCCKIHDEPRFAYRGFMIDSARHMQSVHELKKMIDAAALLKFNKFHWHLSDDQGFRIELEKFPEITREGSVRPRDTFGTMCRSEEPYSGYYTRNEISDIVAYCRERYIEVIPEIDMPGHVSAMLSVHPEFSCTGDVKIKTSQGVFKDILCAGNPATLDFIKELLADILPLFPGEYFHIGGDEAPKDHWKTCTKCQNAMSALGIDDPDRFQVRFCTEVAEFLSRSGKKCIVWNDILKGGDIPEEFTVQRWMDIKKRSAKAADGGSKIIVSNFSPYYLDYSYGQYPLNKVYKFSPGAEFSENGAKNVLGVETPLWTEYIADNEKLEFQALPRWFAVAESAWSEEYNKNKKEFLACAKKLCENLRSNGYNCADESVWNMDIFRRAKECITFYKGMIRR